MKTTKPKKTDAAEKDKERQLQRQSMLRLVEEMTREKGVPRETIFHGIESAIQLAADRSFGGEDDVLIHIDRTSGEIIAQKGLQSVDPEFLGRIAAQAAKQVMIQKIREAESDGVFNEFQTRKGELVTATVQRVEGGTAIVTVSKEGKAAAATVEAILPRSEQIPGESFHPNDRVKAVVLDVRRSGHRVKIVLSRCHPDFVRGLFEQEIPEIQDRTIEIKNVAREAGYRSKVAVSSVDMKVDCVGACVGVRGSRIKNVIEEINGERIDIVRYNDSLQVLVRNALQPAELQDVMLYPRLGRAIVLVSDDQLSLAIGRRGQNVRLASKLVGWDIDIMTIEELTKDLQKAEWYFSQIPGMSPELMEVLITEGFLTYTDLSFMEAEQLAEMAGITEDEGGEIIAYAEEMADRIEREGEPEMPNFDPPEAEEEPAAEGEAVPADLVEGVLADGAPVYAMPTPAPLPAMAATAGLDHLFQPAGPELAAAEVHEHEDVAAPAAEHHGGADGPGGAGHAGSAAAPDEAGPAAPPEGAAGDEAMHQQKTDGAAL